MESDNNQIASAVTPDGTGVLAHTFNAARDQRDLVAVTLNGDPAVETLLSTEFDEQDAVLSPDGSWVAYKSNESGRFEVYVRPFPDMESGRWQVSTAGGEEPKWSPDGGQLLYQAGNRLMAVSIQATTGFATRGTADVLLERNYFFAPNRDYADYDMAPDGRLLMVSTGGQSDTRQINVVLNWDQELLERVPVN